MSQPKWTREQKQAIDVRKGTVLLAAAAGSGKTAVLVQRVIDILSDPSDPVEPKQLLVVTFTRAAAEQMQERISQRFQELLAADPTNHYLRKQMALLSTARISTVHSFCMNLIRANFHLLGIQPDVRLGDEGDMKLLTAELAEDCIEAFYEKDALNSSEDFAQVVKLFSNRGDDRDLPGLLLKIYYFLRSRPYYNQWMDDALAAYGYEGAIEESLWGRLILEESRRSLEEVREELSHSDDAIWAEEFLGLLNEGRWDPIFHYVQSHPAKERKTETAKKLAKQLGESLFCCSEAAFRRDLRHLYPRISTLFELVRDLDRRLVEEKQRRHILDFADLEHLCIQLLVQPGEDGSYGKTQLAEELSKELRYVLVDEYQDTNQTQNLIFQSLSQEDNLFMVGDIKQSIYRFRQADPSIFLGKKRDYRDYDGVHFPAKLFLSNNFRSRQEVTTAVNQVFSCIMKEETAEMDYSGGERLVPSAVYPESRHCAAEYHIVDTTALRRDGGEAALEEASVVAARIRQLLDSGMLVGREGQQHPLEPGDICILLRSPKSHGEIFLQALTQESIPVISESEENYLETLEVSTTLSLLRTIDNPLQDIPLTAALLSPVFRFTAEELAQVRIYQRKRSLYLNCVDLAKEGNARCAAFVEKLQDYRLRASALPAWQLIQYLLEDSGLLSFVAALEQGQQRQANLRLLIEQAKNCEDWGYEGLGGFLRYVEKLQEKEQTLAAAPSAAVDLSAVRIMSIHKSKGLEFPVVFLCETSRPFARRDFTEPIMLHPDLGFACISDDPDSQTSFTTVPLEALRMAGHKQMIAEEMRLLYVAMTRAKEKLIITAVHRGVTQLEDWKAPRLNDYTIRNAACYADWLDMVLLQQREQGAPDFLHIHLDNAQLRKEEEKCFHRSAQADPVTAAYLRELLSIPYSDPEAQRIPSKLTVTEIAKGQQSQEELFSREPNFLKEQGLTAAQRGTAMHNFLSCADHLAAQKDLEGEIRRMVQKKYFTKAEAASLNRSNIRAYYRSELFARICRSPWVKREFSFLMDMGREELGRLIPEIGSHRVTVQGIADLIFEEDSAIILVDYKTDHLSEEELVAKYRPQLELYRSILSRLLDKPVKETLIFSMYHKKSLRI